MENKELTLPFDPAEIQKFKDYLDQKMRTVILLHASPDGDTTGSSLALYEFLKDQDIPTDIVCMDPLSEDFKFLDHHKDLKNDFDERRYEAVFFMDCGDKRMTRFQEKKPLILSEEMYKINIDHHPTNDFFGNLNFVYTQAASCSLIVAELFNHLSVSLTPSMATALLLGIYTDTGGFMHQNTDPLAYKVAGDLVAQGGNISQITKNIFHTYEYKTLKLWGKVLENLYITPEGAAIVGIPKDEYKSIGAKREDLGGVVDYINSMPEIDYTVLLSEDEKGNVKASLRTRKEGVDVKALAEKFGGGGHIKASGFTVRAGHLEKEVKWKIVQDA